MALWVCKQDGVRYAVGIPGCPQCGGGEHYEDGSPEHLAALRTAEAAEVVDEVPDGPADKVLAWVGDDPERALAALLAEQARDKPRATLIDQLAVAAGVGAE